MTALPAENVVARNGLRVARAVLGTAEPCPPTCPICNSDWSYADCAIGPCEVCGEPCRSRDPEGRIRHAQDCRA